MVKDAVTLEMLDALIEGAFRDGDDELARACENALSDLSVLAPPEACFASNADWAAILSALDPD